MLATAVAESSLPHFTNHAIRADARDPLTATGEDLDNFRQGLGLPVVEQGIASGSVRASITGAVTIPGGSQLVLPSGAMARVPRNVLADSATAIPVVATESGTRGNARAGETARFVSPPVNVAEDATVIEMTGGTGSETDDRKRRRILNRLRATPRGGSWGHMREIVLNAVPSIDNVFVYPALGGPASAKVVCTRAFDIANASFIRTVTADQLNRARSALQAELPSPMDVVVQSPFVLELDVALLVTFPEGSEGGEGWANLDPWPALVGADAGEIHVSSVTSASEIVISANTSDAPLTGITKIAWCSANDRKVRTFLVVGSSGGAGAWTIELDKPMTDSTGASVQVNDLIGPAAAHIADYGATWIDTMAAFGPGENTTDQTRLPRAARHPAITQEEPASMSPGVVRLLLQRHPEVLDASIGYLSSGGPATATHSADPPTVLVPRRFVIYPE